MNYISAKNSLAKEKLVQSIVAKIVEKVKSELTLSPTEHKQSMELLLMICTIIENLVDNKGKSDKKKINKLAIAHEVYSKLFTGAITKAELDAITTNIEFLIDNKKIKVYSIGKRIWKNILAYIQKKSL
jgi:hypothetical protein